MTRTEEQIRQELEQLRRERVWHLRRYRGGSPGFMRRTGHRLQQLQAELELKESKDERKDDG